jgi:hypothetical protein
LTDDKESDAWLKGLRDEVRAEARQNGWVRSRYGRELVMLGLTLLGVGAIIAIWGYSTATKYDEYKPHAAVPHEGLRNGLALLGVAIAIADMVGILSLASGGAQRLTRTGRPLASAWLGVAEHLREDEQLSEAPPNAVAIWHRLLAYATAFGVAHTVQEMLPLGPESATRAWSPESGRWRQVRVRYPKWWPPGWGKRPGELIKLGMMVLLQVGIPIAVITTVGVKLLNSGVLDDATIPWYAYAIAVGVIVPFFLMGLTGALQVLVGLGTLVAVFGGQREVIGRAVRVRTIGTTGKWVALDDGTRDEIVAYQVRIPNSIDQGERARLRVRPVTGEVRLAEVIDEPKPAAPSAETATPSAETATPSSETVIPSASKGSVRARRGKSSVPTSGPGGPA